MLELLRRTASYAADAGPGFVAVIAGAFVVLALFVANIRVAAKTGRSSDRLALATHFIALAVIAGNITRIAGIETHSVILGNAAAFCCVSYSLRRHIRERGIRRKDRP